jgi:hypothetical protein
VPLDEFGFVSGHDFSWAVKACIESGFTGCGKTRFWVGSGFSPDINRQIAWPSGPEARFSWDFRRSDEEKTVPQGLKANGF